MTLDEVIRTSNVIIHSGRFTYLKCKDIPTSSGHFLVTKDADEVTVVTEEGNMPTVKYLASEGWFKLIEIRVSQPFVVKGFLAKITGSLAVENLNILVVSTFSKDYLLMRESTYDRAVEVLRRLGFPIQES